MQTSVPDVPFEQVCPYVASGETTLRCAKCSRPLMLKDAKRTPVGYVCPEYVKGRRARYFNAKPGDDLITAAVAGVSGVIAGFLLSLLGGVIFGFYLVFLAGPALGGLVAEAIRRVLRKRRSQNQWLIAAIALVVGGLIIPLAPVLLGILVGARGAGLNLLGLAVPGIGLALAAGTLVARLRI
jgi:hypothetical protein